MNAALGFLCGILIGLLFGVPVGAVGVMTAQRTLTHGRKAGFCTGLGSSVADCVYAGIGAFGLTFISDFLLAYEIPLHIGGGILILVYGLLTLFKKPRPYQTDENKPTGYAKMFFSAFLVGITNPAAILTFLFAFSWFGFSGDMGIGEAVSLVAGVFVGTYTWWTVLTCVVFRFREKALSLGQKRINQVAGIAMLVFSSIIFTRLLIK